MTDRPRLSRFVDRITLPRAIGAVMGVATVFTLLAAVLMRVVEPETFDDFGHAWWWSVQTVSTVGYGDITPVTTGGRLLATAVMIFGIALVPATTTIVVAILINRRSDGRRAP